MSKQQDGWIVGAEVVERSFGYGATRFGLRKKIGKVYANGNFVLEGEKQQWRPWAGTASKTGDRQWVRVSLALVTPEIEDEIAQASRVQIARAAVIAEYERLQKIVRGSDDDEILAAYAALSKASPNTNQDTEGE